jgi:hypothetical protein
LLAVYRPSELYVSYLDLHQAPISVFNAGMQSARVSMKAGHWHETNVFAYHLAVHTMELAPTGLRSDTFEDISAYPVEVEVKALDDCRSETAPAPSASNGKGVITQASAPGSVHRLKAVEQFGTIRVIR